MVIKVFTLFDKKAAVFHPPVYLHSEAEARRHFAMASKQHPDSSIGAYPEDFDLYDLGTFCDNEGRYFGDAPQFVCNLTDCGVRNE